jgi:hypothetical protein
MSEIAHRLDPSLSQSMEIAALVRAPGVSIASAASLIEQYARTRASEAALDAVTRTGDRIAAALEAPLSRKELADA